MGDLPDRPVGDLGLQEAGLLRPAVPVGVRLDRPVGDLGPQVAGLLRPAVLVAVPLVRVPLVRAAVDPGDAVLPASAFRLRWRPVSSEQLLRW